MVVVAAPTLQPAPVRKLRTREVVPTSEHPNFKNEGRTVEGALLHVLGNLQRRYGEAFASEAGLRRMICEDTAHMPGLDTVRRALDRLEDQGVVEQRWLLPGGIMPDGRVCTHGTRLVVLPQCRRHRRALHTHARREGHTNRVEVRRLRTLDQARASVLRPTPPAVDERAALDRKRREAVEQLAALARAWAVDDGKPRPPPDEPGT